MGNPFESYLQARSGRQQYDANETKLKNAAVDRERADKAFNVLQHEFGDVVGDVDTAVKIGSEARDGSREVREQKKFDTALEDKGNAELLDANRRFLLGAKAANAKGVDPASFVASIPEKTRRAIGMTPEAEDEFVKSVINDPSTIDQHLAMLDEQQATKAATAVGQPQVGVKDGKRILYQPMSDGTQKVLDIEPGAEKEAQGAKTPWTVIAPGLAFNRATGEYSRQPDVLEAAIQGEAAATFGKGLGTQQATAVGGLPGKREIADTTIGGIDRVLNNPNIDAILGAPGFEKALAKGGLGGITQFVGDFGVAPGSPAAEAAAQLEFVGSQTFLQGIQALRGTGPISNQEGQAASASVANLSRLREPQAIRAELVRLRGHVQRLVAAAEKEAAGGYTGLQAPGAAAARPGGAAPSPGAAATAKRLKYNPATDELE